MASDDASDDPFHARLKAHPLLWSCVGVSHTLLTAGIVFGWASLLPILRKEGVALSPSEFAAVFTHGAVGNYMCTLPFGLLLDRVGPKTCGVTASVLFALGLVLCSLANQSSICLDIGFTLLGFAGPALQLPTLHLARLFPGEAREGGNGGAALFMSAQAAAFDGGTVVFAIFSVLANYLGMTSTLFLRLYLVVPLLTLATSIFIWPNEILPDPTPTSKYIGPGSPFLSPASGKLRGRVINKLKDAPLSVVLTHGPFYCLASWVAIHILKLNFVVATINDQLQYSLHDRPEQITLLINVFGAMLPFGFVVLPGVAYFLSRSTLTCFQIANTVGLLYGAVLAFFPDQASCLILVVFSSVATSRQLVYSTVFHQTGELFGFKNYGVLLGLTNVVVSAVAMVQGPLVEWAENQQDYFGPNIFLLLCTLPLFATVYFTIPKEELIKSKAPPVTEETRLLEPPRRMPRASSDAKFGV
jgi:MFS family permease